MTQMHGKLDDSSWNYVSGRLLLRQSQSEYGQQVLVRMCAGLWTVMCRLNCLIDLRLRCSC